MHEDDAFRVLATDYKKDTVHKTYSTAATLGSYKASPRPKFADIALGLRGSRTVAPRKPQPKTTALRFYT